MNILHLFIQQTNKRYSNEWINSYRKETNHDILFILRELNDSPIGKDIVHYSDAIFLLNTIHDKLLDYEYIVYDTDIYTNDWRLDKALVNRAIDILKDNDAVDQIVFGKCNSNHTDMTINDINVSMCRYIERDLDNMYIKYDKIKEIFTDKENRHEKPKDNDFKIDYYEYARKSITNLPNFRLEPSVIRINSLQLEDLNHYINKHIVFSNALKLEKCNFTTCFLNYNSVKAINDKGIIISDNRNGDNFTIVTGFLKLPIKRPPKKGTQKYNYLDKAVPTLSIDQNMIIYVSEDCIDFVTKERTKRNLMSKTKIIKITVEDNLYLYDQLDKVEDAVSKNIPPYNIPKYVLSVNSRYNYMKDAIKNNYFNTDYFGWIDFSAGHIVNIPKSFKFTYSNIDSVRVAWIGRFKNNTFQFNHKAMGGGVFIGHKLIMSELIRIHDIEFRSLLEEGHCINDDKLLFLIYEKYPYIFSTYFSGYSSLLGKINISDSK